MSEEILIRQGAPTLAGIKTGSLFPCPCEDREDLLADIRRLNRLLVPKGLCLLPIRFLEGQALLYLYRPAELRRDLQDALASELLRQAGYANESCARCVAQLIRRFRESGESHGMQDLGERAHRHAADAGEVRPLAGHEIGIDIHSVFLPKSTHSDSLRHLPKSARK